MDRRRFLHRAGTALPALAPSGLAAIAGCQDSFDPVEYRMVPGAAPKISAEETPEREYTYVPESDEVRFEWSGETEPMDDWGVERAVGVAANAVGDHLETAGIEDEDVWAGPHRIRREVVTFPDNETAADWEFGAESPGVAVRHFYTYRRDGSLYSKPEIPFEAVVAATPRTVDVTIHLPDHDYQMRVPVVCVRSSQRFE